MFDFSVSCKVRILRLPGGHDDYHDPRALVKMMCRDGEWAANRTAVEQQEDHLSVADSRNRKREQKTTR